MNTVFLVQALCIQVDTVFEVDILLETMALCIEVKTIMYLLFMPVWSLVHMKAANIKRSSLRPLSVMNCEKCINFRSLADSTFGMPQKQMVSSEASH